MIPVNLIYEPTTDTLLLRVTAADGAGDVTLLAMDCKTLSTEDKQRLAHIRDPKQTQRPPGADPVTR